MTIYGECICGEKRMPVTVSDLIGTGCELHADFASEMSDRDIALWIGAMGPFAATTESKDDSHLSASFKVPLDPKIIEHFSAD